jgi:hypothetical protein
MESPSKLINVTRQKDALTANAAVTNSTSLHGVVDLFFIAGAARTMSVAEIESMLERAWAENNLLTLKCIFWAGDIRGGAGERRFFRVALTWLEKYYKNTLIQNLKEIPHFNRWDSLFHLNAEEVLELVYIALTKDKDALCAKWMPRKKQYSDFAFKFKTKYGLSPKKYRKLIVNLSKTVEQQMCKKEWQNINYEHVPSVAMNKYRKAFYRNDDSRFTMFIEKVFTGEKKINASTIFPHDIYRSIEREDKEAAINAQWNALPNYMLENNERILPICDVSGSMVGLPMAISVSLGIYLSERNSGIFKNAFVTFSENPKIQYLQGTLTQRARQLEKAAWDMNTNLNKVFSLILDKAVENHLDEKDMPTTILIISDMEFDSCGVLTNYEAILEKYNKAGYQIPKIVFWNVNGRSGNVPVNAKQKGVALVSGASPAIIKSVLSGKDFSPEGIMIETLNNERYSSLKI